VIGQADKPQPPAAATPGERGRAGPWLIVAGVVVAFGSLWLLLSGLGALGGRAADTQKASDPATWGQRLYAHYCGACHGADGQGRAGVYPPLAQSEWVVGPVARLNRIMLQGPTGPYNVNGVRFSNDTMPAFGQQLDDERIAAILTYTRSSWGHRASAISAQQVAATRLATRGRAAPWTAMELMALPVDDDAPHQPK
jgi:mono/diheme cytochrome c family protein